MVMNGEALESKSLAPYWEPSWRGEERSESPPWVEGEFRVLPDEEPPDWEEEGYYGTYEGDSAESKESKERRKALRKEKERQARERARFSELRQKTALEELKASSRRYRRQYRPSDKEAIERVKRFLKPEPVSRLKDTYIPRAMKGYYVPAPLPEMYPPGPGSAIAGMSTPDYGKLRGVRGFSSPGRVKELIGGPAGQGELGSILEGLKGTLRPPMASPTRGTPMAKLVLSPKQGGSPMARLILPSEQRGFDIALARLRKASALPATKAEHYALQEIVANGDRDTLEHVTSELAQLGIPRVEVGKAVKGLLKKGLVRKVTEARGEPPIYEVARR